MDGQQQHAVLTARLPKLLLCLYPKLTGLRDAQVWDLLAPGGKQELELVKSIGGFDIPDLMQIGEALFFQLNRPGSDRNAMRAHEDPLPCMALAAELAWQSQFFQSTVCSQPGPSVGPARK